MALDAGTTGEGRQAGGTLARAVGPALQGETQALDGDPEAQRSACLGLGAPVAMGEGLCCFTHAVTPDSDPSPAPLGTTGTSSGSHRAGPVLRGGDTRPHGPSLESRLAPARILWPRVTCRTQCGPGSGEKPGPSEGRGANSRRTSGEQVTGGREATRLGSHHPGHPLGLF